MWGKKRGENVENALLVLESSEREQGDRRSCI